MPDPVKIETKTFKTKSQAIIYFKNMLARYEAGERVNNDDALDLSALLKRHAEFAEKKGIGINYFEVMKTEFGTNCFKIIRFDGSSTDFSYLHCVRGAVPKKKTEIYKAFRNVIRFDLLNARHKYFSANKDNDEKILCAVTKERIAVSECHMDHRAPLTFEVIVETFLKNKRLNYQDVKISTGLDNQTAPEIIQPGLAEDFREYHNKIAEISFVKSNINLKHSALNRIKKGQLDLLTETAE
ncbi:MAG: hypothetical protein CMP14_08495 [Rickettsiales bacterium]|nr:hypothetical protein [Rickettsiales bacterium]|tara:strand:- start:2552 stop:3274 length:723 start_codon:yes stop_codon:yes gene_type:complete